MIYPYSDRKIKVKIPIQRHILRYPTNLNHLGNWETGVFWSSIVPFGKTKNLSQNEVQSDTDFYFAQLIDP